MKVLLYRARLDANSGAGQLIRMQAMGLKDAGADVELSCRRGALKFFLQTGLLARKPSARRIREFSQSADKLAVDHGLEWPMADFVFVHSLLTEATVHLDRSDWLDQVRDEAAFFDGLAPCSQVIANSELIKRALVEHFALDADRIRVRYPGYQSARFSLLRANMLRSRARRELRLDASTPLIGFITSGDFQTRGLDIFLASAEQITEARPGARFLVVGSKRLPDWATTHPLVASGRLQHRPKGSQPELWMAALDIFLYPARHDAFGMVVAEAQALGIPVLTSRCVGAAECLPSIYRSWLTDRPASDEFASLALRLLSDGQSRQALSSAGLESIAAFSDSVYATACAKIILGGR